MFKRAPEWWLRGIARAERMTSWIGAGTLAWLLLWYLIDSNEGGRVMCLVFIFTIGFVAVLLAASVWLWKTVLHEMIEDAESSKEWKILQSGHWPPLER